MCKKDDICNRLQQIQEREGEINEALRRLHHQLYLLDTEKKDLHEELEEMEEDEH